MAMFNLLASNIENLELKLEGKLPIDRDELLALVNSWGRNDWFFTRDKNNKEIIIEKCKAKEKYDLSNLDVSKIKNFNDIFKFSDFNNDISSWNVSNATSMEYMFYKANKFNQPLNKWDTSKVTAMSYMFCYANEFNQPLDNWNISKVEDIDYMFFGAKKFNQNINSWNISNVKDMENMFAYSEAFNQLVLWDLSKVEKCSSMFFNAKAFMNKFNKDENLPRDTNEIKEWLIENKSLMEAINIEDNKGKDLDNFLLDFNENSITLKK